LILEECISLLGQLRAEYSGVRVKEGRRIDQRPSHLRVVVNVLLYIEESFGLFLEQFHTSAATGLQQNSDAFSV
jgi:hypothetical protein